MKIQQINLPKYRKIRPGDNRDFMIPVGISLFFYLDEGVYMFLTKRDNLRLLEDNVCIPYTNENIHLLQQYIDEGMSVEAALTWLAKLNLKK